MDIGVLHDVTSYLSGSIGHLDLNHVDMSLNLSQMPHWHLSPDLAQVKGLLEDNLFSNMQKSFNHFVKTGQVWALCIGIVVGYLFRSFTSFG
jgi:hypothetical protein